MSDREKRGCSECEYVGDIDRDGSGVVCLNDKMAIKIFDPVHGEVITRPHCRDKNLDGMCQGFSEAYRICKVLSEKGAFYPFLWWRSVRSRFGKGI